MSGSVGMNSAFGYKTYRFSRVLEWCQTASLSMSMSGNLERGVQFADSCCQESLIRLRLDCSTTFILGRSYRLGAPSQDGVQGLCRS